VAQERYSMLDREHEAEYLPYCQANKVAFLAYSPLANGLLTGKIGPDRKFTGDDFRINNPRFSAENRHRVLSILNELKPIVKKCHLSFSQLVIAWTLAQPGITHALVGARDEDQAVENAWAGSVALSAEDKKAIDRVAEGLPTAITV
jgi:methylglyoxal reductase